MRQAVQEMLLCVSLLNFPVVQLYIDILSALCTNGRKALIVKNIESVGTLCFWLHCRLHKSVVPDRKIGYGNKKKVSEW